MGACVKKDSYTNADIIKAFDRGEVAGFERGIKEGKFRAYAIVADLLRAKGFNFSPLRIQNEKLD